MAELKERIEAEFENIDKVLAEFPSGKSLPELSLLELAGVATLLHNFYNGIENIIKQILSEKNITLADGKSWHKDLLESALKENIISTGCLSDLSEYLAFRHFFNHSYALDLQSDKLEPLVEHVTRTYENFQIEIRTML